MHTVIETDSFKSGAKEVGLSEDERIDIAQAIATNPTQGDLMAGTGGARKVRFKKPGSGKSSGYRVITYYAAEDVPVFLLDVFAKGTKVNLSKSERNELKQILGGIADDYRASTRAKVKQLREKKAS